MMRRRNPPPKDIFTKPRSAKARKYIKLKMYLERALGIFTKDRLCVVANDYTDVHCVGNEKKRQLVSYIIADSNNVKRAKALIRNILTALPEMEFDDIYQSFGLTPKTNRQRSVAYLMQALQILLQTPLTELKKIVSEGEKSYREELAERKRQIIADARSVRSEKAASRREERQQHDNKVRQVVDYLVAIERYRMETGKKLSRRAYVDQHGLNYAKFSKLVKAHSEEARAVAEKEIVSLQGEQAVLEQIKLYLLANHEHKLRTGKKLTAQEYVGQQGLNLARFYRDLRAHKEVATRLIAEQLQEITDTVTSEKAAEKRSRAMQRRSSSQEANAQRVAAFLVEKHKREAETGRRFTVKSYTDAAGISYGSFSKLVRDLGARAAIIAQSEIDDYDTQKREAVYRAHAIEFMARKRHADHTGAPPLNLDDYALQNNLDAVILKDALGWYKRDSQHEVVVRFRELESERLRALREVPKPDPLAAVMGRTRAVKKDTQLATLVRQLRKIAKKPLPRKRGRGGGHVIFSKDPDENDRKLNMWLEIAEDVSEIGLSTVLADYWNEELAIPVNIPKQEMRELILLRIETILKQLNLFEPAEGHPSFSTLSAWRQSKEHTEPELEPEPEQFIEISEPEPDEYTEEWLEEQIRLEEEESHRYLDSPEEKSRRVTNGWIIDVSEVGSRDHVRQLQAIGAIYDMALGWLLPTEKDFAEWKQKLMTTEALASWAEERKPRLVIGIGTTDYTKPWMHKAFNIVTITSATALYRRIAAFKPDALMIYKSSTGRQIYSAFKEAALETKLPLIVFDKGFSDAIPSAQIQGLDWFVDAYNKRKGSQNRLRRANPIRPYIPRSRHWNRHRQNW